MQRFILTNRDFNAHFHKEGIFIAKLKKYPPRYIYSRSIELTRYIKDEDNKVFNQAFQNKA